MADKTENICVAIFFALCVAYTVYAQSAVNCTATGAGRFANTWDTTCSTYTLCVATNATTFTAYNYTCPSTSVFDPDTSLCTAPENYVCNVTTSVCTSDGLIADTSVTDCSSYIECILINGSYVETTYTCPTGTYFNPNTTDCDYSYVCSSTTTTFSCTGSGRFANSADTTCQTYYLCVLASNGTYVQYNYTCPSTSVFNPSTRLCTTSYTCPT